ncbi:PAS domain-containing hybrid sensor histidine kinase/response regulator [Thiorhodovibrio frisius]|uniref:Sensory/regulatory protein RpfC n=1 Tax=Thiorhodovibrio frisius TaxID=631362 RepID=H8Z0M9_9GAMM|nr:PAS domain S-box protein [Thiorhodovibrio frisius]EIC22370.1 PAS domain S-box [Thiorhodovibrio frisius]WPL24669.1 Autoinducer 2 sensor kinase/phosphatase LuxQ [Thiorhodovibrio frisius]
MTGDQHKTKQELIEKLDQLRRRIAEVEGRDAMGKLDQCADIPERKTAEQTEAALRQSEIKYRTLFENVQEAIFVTDAQGRFIDVNQAACDLTGYTREELRALAPSDLAPQGFGPQAAGEWARFIASGRLSGEFILFRKNGVRVIAEYSALANDLPDRHVLILRDISQLKRTEAARKENEARFVRAFHNSGVGMALISLGGHFLEVNDKACQLYGYSRQELLVRTFKDITYPEDLKSSKALYQHYLNGDQNSYELETRYLRQDGEIRWALVTVSKVRDADGKFLYSVAQTLDLTLIKQVQAQLIEAKDQAEAASRSKSEFLANMSHELRTPLNGVQGFLQLLEMSELEPEQAESVDLAMKSSQLLLRVINDILDFSKLEAERMTLLEEPFALATELEPVMAALANQATAKGIALHARIAPTIPTILIGDPARLRQVLFNLVGNAVKFTEHGEVIVQADVLEQIDAEHVRLRCSIRDTGIGVAEDMIDFLFEPFTQADGSPTRRFQGTGLGLSIVKRLVGLMGGQVEMDSTLGEGTHVQFTIMVGTESAEETATSELGATDLKVAEPPAKALRILVAEDEPTNAKVVQKLLEKLGHQVQIASNGRKALALLGSQMFDLVLMDVQMPEMDGVEATRLIRENTTGDLNPSIPIIALTARALAGDREKYLAAGMNDYLSKPINIQALTETLDKVVAAAS